jgi:hypothetical protein
MRVTRPVLCLALVGALTTAGAASAVTKPKPKPLKPVCNLVTDVAGDGSFQAPLPSDDSMDILSADVASDTKNFTAVIRVKNVSAQSLGAAGHVLRMNFALAGNDDMPYLAYAASPFGDVFDYGVIKKGTGSNSIVSSGSATGSVDKVKNEVRITVPLASMKALGKVAPGAKISSLQAVSEQMIGDPDNIPVLGAAYGTEQADTADGTKAYVAGYPSCVKPG